MNMYHPRLVPRPMFDKAARHSAEEPGGWGGIRTHGRLHVAGFQDRCLKPLGHPSSEGFCLSPAEPSCARRAVNQAGRKRVLRSSLGCIEESVLGTIGWLF